MKTAYDIIKKPVITEASMAGIAENKYVFEVMMSANKVEIKKAIEEIFGVQVESVNTVKLPAKNKRMGVHFGKTTAKKKAIVTLKEGSKPIEIFEGMI